MLDLMLAPIAAGLVILALHAYLGLHVIARGVIFVDLAFAQIAALGTTVGLMMGVEHGTPLSLAFSLGFTLLGALIFSFSRLRETVVPQEAIIGITFVVASAAVILIAGFTAEGAEHVAETMTGTLIWVTWPQILRMAAVYAGLGVFYYVFRRRFVDLSLLDDTVSQARLWDFLFYVPFGIVISFSRRHRRRAHGILRPCDPRRRGLLVHEPIPRGAGACVGCGHGSVGGRGGGVLRVGHRDGAASGVRVRG